MAGKKREEKRGPATIQNRKASFDYHFEETFEAGIVLAGAEVKSLYAGRANLTDAYCRVVGNELWLLSFDIESYEYSNRFAPDRRRDRKLLMHRREIDQLRKKTEEKGLSLVPFKVYFKEGKVKVAIALGRGKKTYDKRESIKEKDERRARDRFDD